MSGFANVDPPPHEEEEEENNNNNNSNNRNNNNNNDEEEDDHGDDPNVARRWPWRFLGLVPREVDLDVMDGLARDADVNLPHFPNAGLDNPGDQQHQQQGDNDLDPFQLNDLLPGMVPQNFAARIGLNETPITKV